MKNLILTIIITLIVIVSCIQFKFKSAYDSLQKDVNNIDFKIYSLDHDFLNTVKTNWSMKKNKNGLVPLTLTGLGIKHSVNNAVQLYTSKIDDYSLVNLNKNSDNALLIKVKSVLNYIPDNSIIYLSNELNMMYVRSGDTVFLYQMENEKIIETEYTKKNKA